jgi:hypothetical protein
VLVVLDRTVSGPAAATEGLESQAGH